MVHHNSQTYATYVKSNPNPKRQATAYRNLTGTETQVCVQLVHPHLHYAWLHNQLLYIILYCIYLSAHAAWLHQSTCMQTNMHACPLCVCCVCVSCIWLQCMYACLCLYVQIFLCSILREWSLPTSVGQTQLTRENLLPGIQTKNTFSSLGKWRWRRTIS